MVSHLQLGADDGGAPAQEDAGGRAGHQVVARGDGVTEVLALRPLRHDQSQVLGRADRLHTVKLGD